MSSDGDGQSAGGAGSLRRLVTICNKRGLHARGVVRFFKLVW
jgi:hypothetical protein